MTIIKFDRTVKFHGTKLKGGVTYEVEDTVVDEAVAQGAEVIGKPIEPTEPEDEDEDEEVDFVEDEVVPYASFSRDEFKEALKLRGVEFKGNAKTEVLRKLLIESDKE